MTGEGHQLDLAFLAGFKAYRRARRDIQAIAGGLLTVELQRRVNLGEMVVRTDLNRPIAWFSTTTRQVARPVFRAI
ncbi:Uncharacterised protein [Klebsiella pneumoniae]|uniref:Uncharacterized protein n=1 Tax=Klebsiella pneumoniae TaxID=573 RepID=A0A2X3CSS8_KLEPN|nr:Uncharacterised protein [Klebsiella pneumoniae]